MLSIHGSRDVLVDKSLMAVSVSDITETNLYDHWINNNEIICLLFWLSSAESLGGAYPQTKQNTLQMNAQQTPKRPMNSQYEGSIYKDRVVTSGQLLWLLQECLLGTNSYSKSRFLWNSQRWAGSAEDIMSTDMNSTQFTGSFNRAELKWKGYDSVNTWIERVIHIKSSRIIDVYNHITL